MPGVLAVLTGADALAEGLSAIPHDPLPKTRYDMKLSAAGGGAVFIGPHLPLPVDKARHVGEAVAMVVAQTLAQALDAAEAVKVDYQVLPGVFHSEAAMAPGAPAVWDEVPDNVPIDTSFGDRAATEQAFAARRPCRGKGFPHRAGDRRAARAARGARPLRRGKRALHALCRQRRRGAPEARARRRARHSRTEPARPFPRCRGKFRHPQPRLRRVRAGAVGRAQAGSPGEIHRVALRGVPLRLSGPRPRLQGRARARQKRALPRRARHQYQQCGRALRVALAAVQGRGPHSGLLRHCGRLAACARGLHQHDADQRLSQLGPSGSDVRDRALDRRSRRQARLRPCRAAAAQSRPPRRDALPQRGGHALRQRPLRGEHGPRHGDCRLGGLSGAPPRGGKARRAAWPRACELRQILNRRAQRAGAHIRARARLRPRLSSRW